MDAKQMKKLADVISFTTMKNILEAMEGNQLTPSEVTPREMFNIWLEWEGIVGYTDTILKVLSGLGLGFVKSCSWKYETLNRESAATALIELLNTAAIEYQVSFRSDEHWILDPVDKQLKSKQCYIQVSWASTDDRDMSDWWKNALNDSLSSWTRIYK